MAAFIELALGEDSAVVSTTGAALLEYTVGDRPVVVRMSAFDGAVLAPWPNRIADGRYAVDGRSHQLPITEKSRNTALHGLVAEDDWEVIERSEASVALRKDITAQEGYPFSLTVEVTYALVPTAGHGAGEGTSEVTSEGAGEVTSEGAGEGACEGVNELRVSALARNRGQDPAPFGFGFHPWIHPGADRVDQAQILIPAETWFEADDRLIPQTVWPFDSGSFVPADHGPDDSACLLCKDFRALRSLGSAVLDDAFGTPQHGADGWSRARLRGADDRTVVIGMDESFRAWQVCTGDELGPEDRRRAVAIEPMMCPPNAFAAGSDHDFIEPRGELSVKWSIVLR